MSASLALLLLALSMTAATGGAELRPVQEQAVSQTVELHFQEGFFDDHVEVWFEGRQVAAFVASTRLQTGLAVIHSIDARTGGTLRVAVPARDLRADLHIGPGTRFVIINLRDGSLLLEPADRSPGYL